MDGCAEMSKSCGNSGNKGSLFCLLEKNEVEMGEIFNEA